MIRIGQLSKRIIILLGDFLALQLALLLTVIVRYGGFDAAQYQLNLPAFTVVSLAWIVGFYIAGLYELSLLREPLRLFRTYLEGMIANLAVALAFFYLLPFVGLAPRTILFLFFAISLLLGYGWRITVSNLIQAKFSRLRILFVGPAEELRKVDEMLAESQLGGDVVAAIATSGEPYRHHDIVWLPGIHAFTDALKEHAITTVVLGVRPDDFPELKTALYRSLFTPVDIMDRAEIEEVATGRIPLSYVSETWFLHHLRENEKEWFESAKRVTDVILGIPVALVTAILYPFVALGTKLSSPGPVLYSQMRVGKDGKPFRIWKFRTMRVDAEKNGAQFTSDAKTDPRLFGFGRFMRRTRIDELPQVWNVLMGDLSFIGPRPERPEFVNPLLERMPYYGLRHLTRPGLTGWAQVRFLTPNATIEDNLKKLQYDLYYIKNRSLLLDALILLKTIGVVLRRQGT
ncbi:MAG TPA: exopolysaccharide biosynthesis polyprenyl glycosylphosphotransferase [Verrucomicrobiae bacterium]|nr:exopolysaccharide biosynthesis polyprenyl glycosylphosphotransferase [Verrucomicrobiae bacterium]